MSGHIAQSQNNVRYDYKTIYDAIFVETKFNENKNNVFKRMKILYRYSSLITFRGFLQGMLSVGMYEN